MKIDVKKLSVADITSYLISPAFEPSTPATDLADDDIYAICEDQKPVTKNVPRVVPKAERTVARDGGRVWHSRGLNDLGELVAEELDPSVLFKHNWLALGQSFGLVASSGVGKSSMSVQMAYHWALGKPFLAEPMRPLRICIIQAEDSDRDLKEQRNGMREGLRRDGWSEEDIAKAEQANRIDLPTDFIGKQGDEFIEMLREYQSHKHFDLIIINPLQRFFGGDISSQEDASHFAAGCDEIMKDPKTACCIGIVMHTAKYKTGNAEGRQNVDDYGEYMMAGSHEWTDWLRACFAFQKHGTSEEYFDLRAVKRGTRLGWTDENGEKTTKKVFAHSDGFIYWREADPSEVPADEPKSSSPKRREKPEMDVHAAASYWAKEILRSYLNCGTNDLRDIIFEGIRGEGRTRKDARMIFDELTTNPDVYGLEIVTDKYGKKSFREEGLV